jgi:CheY-like chemotaxis protein
MDGFQATRQVRRWETDHQRPRVPIVALTADAFAETREQARHAGMDGFLTKPIEAKNLREPLQSWLSPASASTAAEADPESAATGLSSTGSG